MKLEERTVPGVRVREKSFGRFSANRYEFETRIIFVVGATDDKCRLMDAVEIGETGSRKLFPLTERR